MNTSITLRFAAACVVASLLAMPISLSAATTQPSAKALYQLGVFPFLPPRELEKIFAPFAASIGKTLEKEVHFHTAATYREFVERTNVQQFDIAFVQPFDYVNLADNNKYVPLATRGERLAAVIVVKEDSPLNNMSELKGKTIAMPPGVAAVSRLTHNLMAEQGLIPGKNIRMTHQRSHASCLQQVLIGAADACATAPPPIRFMQQKMKVSFKEIARTIEIPHTLFVASTRINAEERKKILDTILNWSKTEEGRKMLKRGRMKPFIKIEDKEYDMVRKMIESTTF